MFASPPPDPLRFRADLTERQRLGRLGLCAHDPLQRRVARLVDRVRHGDDSRQRRADDVVPELGLALPGDGGGVGREVGDL